MGTAARYAIGQTIRAQSSDVLQVEAGSLYPALQRLAKKGWVTAKWGQTEANQRAKFYRLTPAGKKQLLREQSRWTELVNAIARIMTPAPRAEEYSRRSNGWLDDDDFQEEIRAHLQIAADDGLPAGRSARRDPRRAKEFGNVTLTTEAARRVWTPWWLEAFLDQLSDLRYVIRALAKNPVFALTVVGVLTLGIGLNAAVFTMLKSIALSPVAGVERSSQLAVIYRETTAGRDAQPLVSGLQ